MNFFSKKQCLVAKKNMFTDWDIKDETKDPWE